MIDGTKASHVVATTTSSEKRADLIVDPTDLPAAAYGLRDVLANSPDFFERGGAPIKLSSCPRTGSPILHTLSRHRIVIAAHKVCRPVTINERGHQHAITLPNAVADLYLSLGGEWRLRPLAGVCTSPLLEADGTVHAADGYDVDRELWCAKIPRVNIPSRPTRAEAEAALVLVRQAFSTFPFADAIRNGDSRAVAATVDLDHPPNMDESCFLTALLTAVCRASLPLAPGLLLQEPSISGAGTGKGLLVRAISAIAFGISPKPFTAGENRAELDKRITAALLNADPVLFIDNVNGRMLQSDQLAQVLTEAPVLLARKLGATTMLQIESNLFVAVTGNGISLTEDLIRRFVVCELDARCENPEQRDLPGNFLDGIARRRSELLTALLTIWRWGRQSEPALVRGRSLGSFELWGSWCRDPLLSLGLRDPVDRITAVKANDPQRQSIVSIFEVWLEHHGNSPVALKELANPIRQIVDPHGRGRQFVAAAINRLVGTRIGGLMLTRQTAPGRWGHSTYAIEPTADP